MDRSIFHTDNQDLEALSPLKAVEAFRELLWAEAASLGIAKNLINVPSAITVKDGGIDAEVKDVTLTGGQGIIKLGLTRYQIKTGEFSLGGDAKIKEILFGADKILRPRIKSCLDAGGSLIVVLFGWDAPDRTDEESIVNRCRLILKHVDQAYETARIEIWRQNNLISFLSPFPSLSLRIAGRDHAEIRSHHSWSGDAEMQREFSLGPAQAERITAVQQELRKEDDARHVRLWGEPGIGKTRLALEATRADDLAPLVLYCDASQFRGSALMNELLKDDAKFHAVLVLDECDADQRSYIWDKFKFRGPRIKIVSIYNEWDESAGNIAYLQAPPLEPDQVKSILQNYVPLPDYANRWVEMCSGSPRVAHVIGSNLKNNPDDLLRPPDTSNVWDRYVVGGDNPADTAVLYRRVVLRHLALFKRFGYVDPVATEGKAIAGITGQAEVGITWAKFQEVVEGLRRRRILQGEYTLYITPKALHIWLWGNWWDTHGLGFNLETFKKAIPESLIESFHEMFRYAQASDAAKSVVKRLLGPGGPFTNDYIKTKYGAHFFLALAEADPESALKSLRRTIGSWTKEELLSFADRRDIVFALERIVEWRELFLDGARLLLALGEAENETWANNASGVFPDLFTPAWGNVAPTELPPIERMPVLKEALSSASRERRLLAIRACDHALETGQFVRMVGSHGHGLARAPRRWVPKTWGELFDYYRAVWLLLEELVHRVPDTERSEVVGVLLGRSAGLLRVQNVAPMVIDTLIELSSEQSINRGEILKTLINILHYGAKDLAPETKDALTALRDDLTGSDFSSRLKRYVGMSLLADEFDEHGNQVDTLQADIVDLAKQAVADPRLLEPELKWLTTKGAENGFRFAFELAKQDATFSLLPQLVEGQRQSGADGSAFFLGGYLALLIKRAPAAWEEALDQFSRDEGLRQFVPELTWRSGVITPASAKRILRLAKEGALSPADFRVFGLGGVIRTLDEDSFKEWVRYLLDVNDTVGGCILLDLYDSYYVYGGQRPLLPDLTYEVLTQPSMLKPVERVANSMVDFHWAQIGHAFLEQRPSRALELAKFVLEHFGADGTIFDRFNSEPEQLLDTICRQHPAEVWRLAEVYLDPPIDARAYKVMTWLQRNLASIPREPIWRWIDENVEKRARFVAGFAPKELPRKAGGPFTRDLLIRYGDREDVRRSLLANLQSEGWAGSAVSHYEQKREQLLALKREEEDNENVRRWVNEFIDDVGVLIEQSKIREERDDFRNPPV